VIRRGLLAIGGVAVSVASFGVLTRRASRRLLDAPRVAPSETGLRPALDALGGEVVRFRSRDGLRLSARWLDAERDDPSWEVDSHEAVLLLHGWSGSIVPGAGHSQAHQVEPAEYETRTTSHLRKAFLAAREAAL
jgi:hypothetical protein